MDTLQAFDSLDIRVGRVTAAELNPKARKPAYVMTIDFGAELGSKTTSAQLTENYTPETLVGRQVVAVVNFPPKRIAGVKSEVLVLGGVHDDTGVVLLRPDRDVPEGASIA